MAKYIHYYRSESDFERDYDGAGYEEPWVSFTEGSSGGTVNYNKNDNGSTVEP